MPIDCKSHPTTVTKQRQSPVLGKSLKCLQIFRATMEKNHFLALADRIHAKKNCKKMSFIP
jgi:hypothetical protein